MPSGGRPAGPGARLFLLLPVAVLAATGFLPWATSGRITRSGYSLVTAVRGAGLADEWPVRVAALGLPLVPLAAAAVVAAVVFGRVRVAAGLAATAGGVGVLAGLLVVSGPVAAEVGATLAVVAGVATMAAAGWTALQRGRR